MVSTTDIKGELVRLLDQLNKEQLLELLDEARWLLEEPDPAEVDEIKAGLAEIERGETMSLDEVMNTSGD